MAKTRNTDPVEVADRLHSAAIHVLRRVRREDAATGLPGPQLSALSVIVFRGPIPLGALAEAEQVRPPTMTRIVAALEAARLVTREVDARDRRSARVRATARGERMLKEGRLRRVRALANDLAAFPAADRAKIAAALDVLETLVGRRHGKADED